MTDVFDCFKAYDVRGRIPDQLNEDIARRIGKAYAEVIKPGTVVVGHDIRLTSESIKGALIQGLLEQGVSVQDIGLCGTEEIYFATAHLGVGGGIAVTASHNPRDYNGMKFVREGAKPISGDSGLADIRALAEANDFTVADTRGSLAAADIQRPYVEHLLSYSDVSALKPLKIVCTAGNGGAGRVVDALEPHLPFEFIKVHHEPDGHFPNGVPNPLLVENRAATADRVVTEQADLGIAWDGDFDRCFFFDNAGHFIEGYYIVGLLAEVFLSELGPQRIVHDPRLTWNTQDIARVGGGEPVLSKTGHAFIKERMREVDAVYGGEMSVHHYFKEFAYCDSGMIPWLLIAGLMSRTGQSLGELVAAREAAFPCSGEINREVANPAALLAAVEAYYATDALGVEKLDGLGVEFAEWRFNLRMSNTEPVVRLNVESRGDQALMAEKTEELLALIDG
ncbi:MAG: phosphomannomutase [Alteromonadaceae bacterium]|nr:phosphomannomutase [Alteromonadaceae bacterium]